MNSKKSQISIEYLIIIGFVTFVIIGILGVAFFYSGTITDRIKMNQIDGFAEKIISSSESVFYSGSPSKLTISAYLPEGVEEIEVQPESILFTVQTNSGINKISFSSKVPLAGNIPNSPGVKRIKLEATVSALVISPA